MCSQWCLQQVSEWVDVYVTHSVSKRHTETEIKSKNYETLTTYCWPFCHLNRKYDTFSYQTNLMFNRFDILSGTQKKTVRLCSTAIRFTSEVHCYWSFEFCVEFGFCFDFFPFDIIFYCLKILFERLLWIIADCSMFSFVYICIFYSQYGTFDLNSYEM